MDRNLQVGQRARSIAGPYAWCGSAAWSIPLSLAALAVVGLATIIPQANGDPVITRSVVSANGEMTTSGGRFHLAGTIGQPVTNDSSGGRFELTSGFWVRTPPGDFDSDGVTGLVDLAEFSTCISAPDAAAEPFCSCFDIDSDGDVDLRDFARIQAAFNESR